MNTKMLTGVVEAVLGLVVLVMGPLVMLAVWNQASDGLQWQQVVTHLAH